MKRALIAATIYFLALFTLGFVLGTVRVTVVAPRVGPLAAMLAEMPVMLVAAYFTCRWSVRRWRVSPTATARWAMALWFLVLLSSVETLLGAALFGRSMAEQWTALATPSGLVGLSGQIIAASLPIFGDCRVR